jgi:hypothetical protein
MLMVNKPQPSLDKYVINSEIKIKYEAPIVERIFTSHSINGGPNQIGQDGLGIGTS